MNDLINRAIAVARLKFGGDDGIFNTACFESAIFEIAGRPLPKETSAQEILMAHPHVKMLRGGCHWQYYKEPQP